MDFLDFLLLNSLEEMSKSEKAPAPHPHIEIPLRCTQAEGEEPSLHSARYTYPVIKKFFKPIADITVDEEHAIVLMDIREGPATTFGALEMGYRQEEFFKEWRKMHRRLNLSLLRNPVESWHWPYSLPWPYPLQ